MPKPVHLTAATLAIACALLLLRSPVVSASAPAAEAKQNIKIGFLDGKRLLFESKRGKEIAALVAQRRKLMQKRIAGEQESINERRKNLQERSATLDVKSLKAIEAEIDRDQLKVNKLYQKANREILEYRDKLLGEFEKTCRAKLTAFAKQHGYTAIYKSGSTHYHSDAVDVTDAVVKAMDKD